MGFFFGQTDTLGTYLDYINIQIRLFERSGNIEVHIGPYIMNTNPDTVFDLLPGPFVGFLSMVQNNIGGNRGEVVSVSGSMNNPKISDDPFAFMEWPIPEHTVFKFVNTTTSIKNIDHSDRDLKIFPNPVSDRVTIQSAKEIYQIKIFNTIGQQVFATKKNQFSLNHLSRGVYSIVVYQDGKQHISKLIKI